MHAIGVTSLAGMGRSSRRLAHLHAALHARRSPSAAGSPASAQLLSETPPPKLLSDAQVASFVKDGFLLVPQTELPKSFHDDVYRRCVEHHSETENRGYFTKIPQLEEVLRTPSTVGALTSLLGSSYVQHPHRTMHTRAEEVGGDQDWHKVSLP